MTLQQQKAFGFSNPEMFFGQKLWLTLLLSYLEHTGNQVR